jgi:hypothetical protein
MKTRRVGACEEKMRRRDALIAWSPSGVLRAIDGLQNESDKVRCTEGGSSYMLSGLTPKTPSTP